MTTTTTVLQRINAAIDRPIRRMLLSQRLAKAYVFSSYADAEGSGEGKVFDRALNRATDPKLKNMIRKHQEDELRHERILEERREQLGLPRLVIPPHLKMIDKLSAAAGGLWDLPMDRDEHVARMYTLLFVIEERALEEFSKAADLLEELDDLQSAEVLRSIAADEARHLKYCRAIGRRYAESDEAFERGIETMRDLEQRVYAEQGRSMVKHMIDEGLLELPVAWRLFLGPLLRIAGRLDVGKPLNQPAALAA